METGDTGALFKTVGNRGRAGHEKVVAKSILLAAFNGQCLPHLKMPLYLRRRAFDKMYDWYSDDSIYAKVNTFRSAPTFNVEVESFEVWSCSQPKKAGR